MVSEEKSWKPRRLETSKQIWKGKKLYSDLLVPEATIRDEWGILIITFSYYSRRWWGQGDPTEEDAETTENRGMMACEHQGSGNSPGPLSPSARRQTNKNYKETTLGWLGRLQEIYGTLHWFKMGRPGKSVGNTSGISKWISRCRGRHSPHCEKACLAWVTQGIRCREGERLG